MRKLRKSESKFIQNLYLSNFSCSVLCLGLLKYYLDSNSINTFWFFYTKLTDKNFLRFISLNIKVTTLICRRHVVNSQQSLLFLRWPRVLGCCSHKWNAQNWDIDEKKNKYIQNKGFIKWNLNHWASTWPRAGTHCFIRRMMTIQLSVRFSLDSDGIC